jgi:hypothetical protein
MTVLFFIQKGVYTLTAGAAGELAIRLISGALLMLVFIRLVWVVERKELRSFPVIGRYI